jgi:hypothetical protein
LSGEGTWSAPTGAQITAGTMLDTVRVSTLSIVATGVATSANWLSGAGTWSAPTASQIGAGSLASTVIASSIAVSSVLDGSIVSMAASKVNAGSLGASVIASSVAVSAVLDGSIVNMAASKVNAGSLGSSVIASSVAVNSVLRESLKDICLDASYVILTSTTAAGTKAIRISKFFSYAVTITTITAQTTGGVGVVFNIEERTVPASAGTDIWSGDVSGATAWTGTTLSNAGLAANTALYIVPTSWTTSIDTIEIKGWAVRD